MNLISLKIIHGTWQLVGLARIHSSIIIIVIEIGWWLTIPIFIHNILCHFRSSCAIENEAHVVLKCALYDHVAVTKFPSLFENVVLGSLESFFQTDHLDAINIYLTKAKALHHSRESDGWRLLWCDFLSLAFVAYMTVQFFHFASVGWTRMDLWWFCLKSYFMIPNESFAIGAYCVLTFKVKSIFVSSTIQLWIDHLIKNSTLYKCFRPCTTASPQTFWASG